MKPLLLLRSAAILSLTVWLASCSSKETKTTSGGAHFRLNSAGTAGACLDPTASITISVKGEDGKDKLIPDGADGANVSCAYDDNTFHVTVSGNSGGIQADGTFSGANKMVSADAKMLIVAGTNKYKTPSDGSKPCTITFTKKSDGALLGRFVCPQVDQTNAAGVCAVTALSADGFTPESYFQFADCAGL